MSFHALFFNTVLVFLCLVDISSAHHLQCGWDIRANNGLRILTRTQGKVLTLVETCVEPFAVAVVVSG